MAKPLGQEYIDSLQAAVSVTKDINREVGARIKARREALGYSQNDVARVLEVDRSVISQYETGSVDIPLSRLVALSTILSMTADDILPDAIEKPVDDANESRRLVERMRSLMDRPEFATLLTEDIQAARKK